MNAIVKAFAFSLEFLGWLLVGIAFQIDTGRSLQALVMLLTDQQQLQQLTLNGMWPTQKLLY